MRKFMRFILLAALMLTLLTGCGSKESYVTEEQAKQIALEAAGLTADQVDDIHTHVGEYENIACYSVHLTVGDAEYEYVIAGMTGQILLAPESD